MTWKASIKCSHKRWKARRAGHSNRTGWTSRSGQEQHKPCTKSTKISHSGSRVGAHDNSIPSEYANAHVDYRAAVGDQGYDNYPALDYSKITKALRADITPDHTSPSIRPQGMSDEDWSEHLSNTIYKHHMEMKE